MLFEILYQELARNAAIIQMLVAGMSHAEAHFKSNPESWSVLEVICHLYDEEREDFRQRLDVILHRQDQDFPPINPAGWVTDRQYNQRDLAEMVDKFAAERAQSLVWLKGLTAPNWDAVYTNAFGSMKAGDMLAAWAAHDNLHLRQLVELKRSWLENVTAPYEMGYAGEW